MRVSANRTCVLPDTTRLRRRQRSLGALAYQRSLMLGHGGQNMDRKPVRLRAVEGLELDTALFRFETNATLRANRSSFAMSNLAPCSLQSSIAPFGRGHLSTRSETNPSTGGERGIMLLEQPDGRDPLQCRLRGRRCEYVIRPPRVTISHRSRTEACPPLTCPLRLEPSPRMTESLRQHYTIISRPLAGCSSAPPATRRCWSLEGVS